MEILCESENAKDVTGEVAAYPSPATAALPSLVANGGL